jgi:hypothetical protein
MDTKFKIDTDRLYVCLSFVMFKFGSNPILTKYMKTYDVWRFPLRLELRLRNNLNVYQIEEY